jgi:hypothetical protein
VADGDALLVEALSLIEQGSFGAAAAMLSRVAGNRRPSPLSARVDAACELCRTGEAHRQAAEELEAAANQQRTSALQVQRRLLTLLSGSGTTADQPAARPKSLRDRFRRRRASARSSAAPTITPSEHPPTEATSTVQAEAGSTAIATTMITAPVAPHAPIGPPAAPEAPDADVVARVLGTFELIVLGREVREWGGGKGRAVLQFLLLNRDQPVRRDVLMDLLWPNHPH